MSYEAYTDFVYDAILRDWESLADEITGLKETPDEGNEVRIVKEDTDLTMSIEGRTAVNSDAPVVYGSLFGMLAVEPPGATWLKEGLLQGLYCGDALVLR